MFALNICVLERLIRNQGVIFIIICLLICEIKWVYARDLEPLMHQVQCFHQCRSQFSSKHCQQFHNFLTVFQSKNNCQDACDRSKTESCLSLCSCIKQQSIITHAEKVLEENWIPRLHCRTENSLFLVWRGNSTVADVDAHNVIIETTESNKTSSTNGVLLEEITEIQNLTPNTSYSIRVWMYAEERWISSNQLLAQTLPESYSLHPITKLSVEHLSLQEDNTHYAADLTWEPADEMVCKYEVLWWMHDEKYEQREITNPADLYKIKINDLDFGTQYSVAITALSTNQGTESSKFWYTFDIPTCLETFRNLSVCAPDQPLGVIAKETLIKIDWADTYFMYNVSVGWKIPEMAPTYYIIKLVNIPRDVNVSPFVQNVSGIHNHTEFEMVFLGNQYEITVQAISPGGKSQEAFLYREIVHLPIATIAEGPDPWNIEHILLIISIITVVVIIFICSIIFIAARRRKKTILKRSKYFNDLEQKSTKQNLTIITHIANDENDDYCTYEVNRDRVVLDRVLGEGAFGIVRHGWLLPDKTEIAVKTLKEGAASDEIHQLKSEINVMKTVGVHTHIVSMIGCCTDGKITDIMLLVEYCALGDLLGYLRRSWSAIQQSCCSTPNTPLSHLNSGIFFANNMKIPTLKVNHMYEIEDQLHDSTEAVLTSIDLLSFARQIAMGMEYLSGNRIVHRDLAARNILLTADRTLKIADFGLSRDIYQQNIYRRAGNGKLPIKWMSLEALSHQIYTTQSDVWSFGILLWEIVTLGGNPYPSTPTNRLLPLLKSGYRMECPANCSQEVYSIMHACWHAQPKERPNFHQIRVTLEALLENSSQIQYLNLDELSQSEYTRDSIGNHYDGLINR